RSFRWRLHALRRGRRRWSGAAASTSGVNETAAFTPFMTRQARCESSKLYASARNATHDFMLPASPLGRAHATCGCLARGRRFQSFFRLLFTMKRVVFG